MSMGGSKVAFGSFAATAGITVGPVADATRGVATHGVTGGSAIALGCSKQRMSFL